MDQNISENNTMSCGSQTCRQSGCYKDVAVDGGAYQSSSRMQTEPGQLPSDSVSPSGNSGRPEDTVLCVKCKLNESIAATAAASESSRAGGDTCRFCADCFRSNLYGKFRFAVTSNALISPSDNVLVAFSGGPSSRVALQFVHEMQLKAQKNFDASRERSRHVFGVGVVFIDESTSLPMSNHEYAEAIEEMKHLVSNLAPPAKRVHVVPIESVYSSDFTGGRERLKELLSSVHDVTGKEDLLEYLRMLSVQKVALDNEYTKVVLGTCTSRIACRVLEATVKGQGYSLAADIQYVDARWEIPVVLPMHDCLSQELKLLCDLDSLKTNEVFNSHRSGINALIASFVKLLQEENPSRESTIVRTAGKLTPFYFNRISEGDDHSAQLASQRRQKKYNLKPYESLPLESFCQICSSPLKKFDVKSSYLENGILPAEDVRDACCSSCQFQILPKEISAMEHFYSLLPQKMAARADCNSIAEDRLGRLREQIQDCLLSDTEDGT